MRSVILVAALALAGCANTYNLTVMPRDSGKLYSGVASDAGSGAGEGLISITIEGTTYNGTWVETTPSQATGYVTGGVGWGWGGRGRGSLGSFVTMDNPQGGEAKALLTASNGSGLRCDFRSGYGRGGGVCLDDKGKAYDVQARRAPSK
jgi:hypothetical protein